jgi:hypothetical protein
MEVEGAGLQGDKGEGYMEEHMKYFNLQQNFWDFFNKGKEKNLYFSKNNNQ